MFHGNQVYKCLIFLLHVDPLRSTGNTLNIQAGVLFPTMHNRLLRGRSNDILRGIQLSAARKKVFLSRGVLFLEAFRGSRDHRLRPVIPREWRVGNWRTIFPFVQRNVNYKSDAVILSNGMLLRTYVPS